MPLDISYWTKQTRCYPRDFWTKFRIPLNLCLGTPRYTFHPWVTSQNTLHQNSSVSLTFLVLIADHTGLRDTPTRSVGHHRQVYEEPEAGAGQEGRTHPARHPAVLRQRGKRGIHGAFIEFTVLIVSLSKRSYLNKSNITVH